MKIIKKKSHLELFVNKSLRGGNKYRYYLRLKNMSKLFLKLIKIYYILKRRRWSKYSINKNSIIHNSHNFTYIIKNIRKKKKKIKYLEVTRLKSKNKVFNEMYRLFNLLIYHLNIRSYNLKLFYTIFMVNNRYLRRVSIYRELSKIYYRQLKQQMVLNLKTNKKNFFLGKNIKSINNIFLKKHNLISTHNAALNKIDLIRFKNKSNLTFFIFNYIFILGKRFRKLKKISEIRKKIRLNLLHSERLKRLNKRNLKLNNIKLKKPIKEIIDKISIDELFSKKYGYGLSCWLHPEIDNWFDNCTPVEKIEPRLKIISRININHNHNLNLKRYYVFENIYLNKILKKKLKKLSLNSYSNSKTKLYLNKEEILFSNKKIDSSKLSSIFLEKYDITQDKVTRYINVVNTSEKKKLEDRITLLYFNYRFKTSRKEQIKLKSIIDSQRKKFTLKNITDKLVLKFYRFFYSTIYKSSRLFLKEYK